MLPPAGMAGAWDGFRERPALAWRATSARGVRWGRPPLGVPVMADRHARERFARPGRAGGPPSRRRGGALRHDETHPTALPLRRSPLVAGRARPPARGRCYGDVLCFRKGFSGVVANMFQQGDGRGDGGGVGTQEPRAIWFRRWRASS